MKTYNVKEIAEMLKINPETVRRWIRSGKLQAIQDSRKEGNVVTEQMLKAFLKSSPKYAGLAIALFPIVGLTSITALSGFLAQQYLKNTNAKADIMAVRKLLKTDIDNRTNIIRRKEEEIRRKEEEIEQIQNEIKAEVAKIEDTQQLMQKIDIQMQQAKQSEI